MDTPLAREIKRFVIRLSAFAFVLGCIFFTIGMAQLNSETIKKKWISVFINGFIVVMIACVPEGLPMTVRPLYLCLPHDRVFVQVVSCLTITARRLAARKVFVKQLQSVEVSIATCIASELRVQTLGSATVIATDKTGTLTQNKSQPLSPLLILTACFI